MKSQNLTAEEQYNKMVNTPVSRLIAGLAIPTVISMLVTSIYDIDLPDSKEQTARFNNNFKNRYIFRIYTFNSRRTASGRRQIQPASPFILVLSFARARCSM